MTASLTPEKKQLEATHRILKHLKDTLDIPISVQLWDGSKHPLSAGDISQYTFVIEGPRTVSTLLKKPTLENFIRHYAVGKVGFSGGDMHSFMEFARKNNPKKKWKQLNKPFLIKELLPFVFGPTEKLNLEDKFKDDATGENQATRSNSDYIQFHYDVSNDFYKLFLDPEMQYSCAYFKTPETSLAQAQLDKLEHTCRKLQLKPGERLMDIGSGWGGLICYAAKNFGVTAHGVTLSKEQFAHTEEKIKREGLEGKVTVELTDYMNVQGTFDKVVSVGMFEHIGLANVPAYFSKMNTLLRERGILLNHAITRRAKSSKKKFSKVRPERKFMQKYIFPGFEMDHIGHSIEQMEIKGFEVKDVESLREHYAMTCEHWAKNLDCNKEKAIEYVGVEKYRLWVAYLAGVALGFADGNTNIYQTVAVKRKKGLSGMPLTREHIYT